MTITPTSKLKFRSGRIVTTRGAATFDKAFLTACLNRHLSGDWGNGHPDDHAMNEEAVKIGGQILSAYQNGTRKLWIITEGNRSVTTLLLPEEY